MERRNKVKRRGNGRVGVGDRALVCIRVGITSKNCIKPRAL